MKNEIDIYRDKIKELIDSEDNIKVVKYLYGFTKGVVEIFGVPGSQKSKEALGTLKTEAQNAEEAQEA